MAIVPTILKTGPFKIWTCCLDFKWFLTKSRLFLTIEIQTILDFRYPLFSDVHYSGCSLETDPQTKFFYNKSTNKLAIPVTLWLRCLFVGIFSPFRPSWFANSSEKNKFKIFLRKICVVQWGSKIWPFENQTFWRSDFEWSGYKRVGNIVV